MSKRIFREVSLKHLSTPEQIDDVIRVTSPAGWLALGALALLMAVGIVLSIIGTVPEKVVAKGILISPGGVVDVISSTQGQVTKFLVTPGDWVASGQVIAHVAQPDIASELKTAEAELAGYRSEYTKFLDFQHRGLFLQKESLAHRRGEMSQQLVFIQERLKWLQEREQIDIGLFAKGLIERKRVIETKISINESKEELEKTQNILKQIDFDQENITMAAEKEVLDRAARLAALERKADATRDRLKRNTDLVSPYSGYIVEFKINAGEVVDTGRALFSMLPQAQIPMLDKDSHEIRRTGELVGRLYVKPEDGKKIRVGMAVQISPSTVKREEFGFIEGTVSHVASIPSTQEGIQRMLKNQQLVQELTGGGAPFEVAVDLSLDPHSHNGYKWSSSAGPWIEINSGTLVDAGITVRSLHLISLIIPAFENLFEQHSS